MWETRIYIRIYMFICSQRSYSLLSYEEPPRSLNFVTEKKKQNLGRWYIPCVKTIEPKKKKFHCSTE